MIGLNRISKNELFYTIIITILISLGCFIYLITNNYITILIYFNFVFVFYSIIYCKYSIYSLIIFLSNYPIFPLIYKYYWNDGVSSLGISTLETHMVEILITILIFNIITMSFVFFSKILRKEHTLITSIYDIPKTEMYFFILIVLMSLIISMPHIPFLHASLENRQNVLLQGGAWNYVGLCAFAFLTAKHGKKHKVIFYVFIIMVVWNIGNYNRVDVMSLIIFYLIRYITLNKISKRKTIKYFAMLFLLFLFSIFVGEYRVSTSINANIFISFINSIGKTVSNIFNQSTAADIIHVYNTGIDYTKNLGLLYGDTYSFYLYSLVPFLGKYYANSHLFTNVLLKYYFNLGGGFFLTEPYLNFGILGVIFYAIMFNVLLYIILRKNNLPNYIYYVCMWTAAFRFQWYGLVYIERSFIQIIPLYLIIHAFFKFKNAKAFKPTNYN